MAAVATQVRYRVHLAPRRRPVPDAQSHYPDAVTAKRSPTSTSAATGSPPPRAPLSYEAAVERLESIVAQIESGEIGLEDSMALYEEGIALTQRCKEILATAEQRVEALSRRTQDGKPLRPNSAAAMTDQGASAGSDEPGGDDPDLSMDDDRADEDDDSGPDQPRRATTPPDEPPF